MHLCIFRLFNTLEFLSPLKVTWCDCLMPISQWFWIMRRHRINRQLTNNKSSLSHGLRRGCRAEVNTGIRDGHFPGIRDGRFHWGCNVRITGQIEAVTTFTLLHVIYMYSVSMATGPSLTTFIPLLYNVLLITLTRKTTFLWHLCFLVVFSLSHGWTKSREIACLVYNVNVLAHEIVENQ